ncbi:MAG TPA: (d)CMP kinase [Egibacteraceae bacterium]|nr:(d)CMP kinase [Egibacteraceae bacterium]
MTVVAIDGQAGAGKSTVAAALAERLGLAHVDTGAYYRAATLAVLRAGVDVADERACARIVADARIGREGGRTLLDGEDVEDEIRGPAVTAAVSTVAAHRGVRAALLDLQRQAVTAPGAVVEGRDAGTVVVPEAEVKVWLTAGPERRAERRAAQLGAPDADTVSAHAADLARRDAEDAARMAPAPDAIVVDTTQRSVESLVDELAARVRAAGALHGAVE